MRFAIISDIHSNLQAWHAVWEDIQYIQADCVINLGDLVGYGPNPVEVCELARKHVDQHLLGNHDAAIRGNIDLKNWNKRARDMIAWTREQLDESACAWLGTLGHTLGNGFFRCAHSEFWKPDAFYYIKKPRDALFSWRKVPEPLLFVGHTHRPSLYVLGKSRQPHQVDIQPFVIEPGKRYLVNVGSVGFPRDHPDTATYCIFDEPSQVVTWRHVPFDYASYCRSMRRFDRGDSLQEDG